MIKSGRNLLLAAVAALALGACSSTGESLTGAGAGAIVGGTVAGPVGAVVGGVAGAVAGPTVANEAGVPRRRYAGHRRHRRHTASAY